MKKKKLSLRAVITALLVTVVLANLIIATSVTYSLYKRVTYVDSQTQQVRDKQAELENFLSESLYNDHLQILDKQELEIKLQRLEEELSTLQSNGNTNTDGIETIYTEYQNFKTKLERNKNAKLDIDSAEEKVDEWAQMLLDQNFENLVTQIREENSRLDSTYNEYLASLPPPPPTSSEGYSYITVNTPKGTHGVYLIKVPLNQVRVKTVAAISDDCSDNCPAKSLADYVKESSGFAGINGSYNCPPDYPACAGKINSFDYAFYDSDDKKWFNKDALTWFKTGMFTFRGSSYNFYKETSEYSNDSVDAAISNYPSLLKNSEVVVKDSDLTAYQKVKGLRGALGVGGENIYLAQISNATVEEAAYAMQALGAIHALNLDGGGTSALYINGSYVVGPGRSLSNAIVLVKN